VAIASALNVAIKRYITEGCHVRMKDAQAVEQKCSEKALIITSFFKRSRKRNKEENTNHPGEGKVYLYKS